jgi:hypothetical protein
MSPTAWIMFSLSMASASSLNPATSRVFFSVIGQYGCDFWGRFHETVSPKICR